MFFYLSKLLSFLIDPFIWVLILLAVSLLTKGKFLKNKSFIASLFVLILFSNNVVFLETIRLWEEEGTKIENVKHHDVGLVLGGIAEYNNDLKRLSIRRGGDRIWQAIHLYHIGKIDKILISGDSGYLIDKGLNEAIQLKELLVQEKIPSADILIETVSKNTYQNAFESKKVLDLTPENESVLLITSSLHMKRSKACFKKVGFINFDTFTTDHYTGSSRNYYFDQYIIPSVSVFVDWNRLIHEWLGYLAYWVVGYI
tara:strand:- start:125 stop:892 length:768 start_codon:yes stop_codon:yes gene_type:complete